MRDLIAVGVEGKQQFGDALWLKMQGETWFITGGSGFFGYWFLTAMIDANRRLGTAIKATVLSRSPQAFMADAPELFADGWVDCVPGDVLDFSFPEAKFSRVLHLATTTAKETFNGEDPLLKFKVLVNGTERVLQFASICGAKNVFFTSSGAIYDTHLENIIHIPEDFRGAPVTTNPTTAIAQAKRAAEFLCGYYADRYGFEFSIARCFSFVGPKLPLDLHYAIGNFIRDAMSAPTIAVKGDGSPLRSYLYMGDLVLWLLSILVNSPPNRIYNIGSDQAISIGDLALRVRDLLSPEKPVTFEGQRNYNIGNINRSCYVPDISRAKAELGVDVWTTLDSAIVKTFQYAKSNG